VLAVFGTSRLFFFAAGTLAAVLLPWAERIGSVMEPKGFLDYWAHWDGAWYAEIATKGYGARDPASTAFFPLFPLLVGVGSAVGGGPALWGVILSLVATLFATYFVYRITEKFAGVGSARAATLCFAFFPTAFFLGAPYTEALFVALTAGSYWAAYVRRDLLLAGILGALAAATRNVGVLLLIPLLYEWLRAREEFGWRGLLSLCLVPTGLLAYVAFLWARFGDPLVFARQQSEFWGRELTNPADTLGRAWAAAGDGIRYVLDPTTLFLARDASPALYASNTLNLAFFALFVVLMGVGFAVLPPGLSVYTFVVTLLPVLTPTPSFPLMSMPRFVLGSFPIFLVLGFVLSRNKPALWIWLVASGALGIALTAMFTTWRWVA
jgi:hypothetical protein